MPLCLALRGFPAIRMRLGHFIKAVEAYAAAGAESKEKPRRVRAELRSCFDVLRRCNYRTSERARPAPPAAPSGWLRHAYRSNTTIPMIMAHAAIERPIAMAGP